MILWPKWGTFLFRGLSKAPGRHLIGQRRPPPEAGHLCAGCIRFLLLTPQEVPDCCTHLPKHYKTIRPQRPTTTSGLMPLIPPKTGKNHLRDAHEYINYVLP